MIKILYLYSAIIILTARLSIFKGIWCVSNGRVGADEMWMLWTQRALQVSVIKSTLSECIWLEANIQVFKSHLFVVLV